MKTLNYIWLAIFGFFMLFSCEKTEILDVNATAKKGKSVATTVPFKANFHTNIVGFVPVSPNCSAPHTGLNSQSGEGTATHLGKFTTDLSFCVDLTNINASYVTLPYVDAQGSFVAANGDSLHFIGSGVVKSTTKPGYIYEFQDTFTIVGGSGRFKDASGTLVTDSYVNGPKTDHVWTGSITIVH